MGNVRISKDGQMIVLPEDRITGRELKEHLSIDPGRIVTVVEGGKTRAVGDNEQIKLREGAYLSDAPRFQYGFEPPVGQRLAMEVAYISQLYRQEASYGHDNDMNRWWVFLPVFILPGGWQQYSTPILATITDRYPCDYPDGFYLSNELRDIYGRTPAHYFEARSAHNPLTDKNWAWFCIHPRGWRSSHDIRDGDSVAKYLTLIHLVMSEVVSPGF